MKESSVKLIDTTYDFRNDSNGLDPDRYSSTLRSYHQKLWSKQLPNGKYFGLTDTFPNWYLSHQSDELGEHLLSSDSITHTYSTWKRMGHIICQIPEKEVTTFFDLSYTIGWFLLFPANRVNRLWTINQDRGCNKHICDRMDLTLECIRLFYLGKESPLSKTFFRYENYFDLFESFQWYCEFFLLHDLVSANFDRIQFFLPFHGFEKSPLPQSVNAYLEYKNNNMQFLWERNGRIAKYWIL